MEHVQIDFLPGLAIVCAGFLAVSVMRIAEKVARRRATRRTRVLIERSRE